ncbi:MAG: FtsB family cell division protein [Terriglobales bacterium]
MRTRSILHGLKLALLAGAAVVCLAGAIFGANGYLALRQRQNQYAATMQQLQVLEAKNRDLNQAVRELRSDPIAIEGIAREQLHLTKPGEVVYTYAPPRR